LGRERIRAAGATSRSGNQPLGRPLQSLGWQLPEREPEISREFREVRDCRRSISAAFVALAFDLIDGVVSSVRPSDCASSASVTPWDFWQIDR